MYKLKLCDTTMGRSSQVSALLRHFIFGHSATRIFLKSLQQPKSVLEMIQTKAKQIQQAHLTLIQDAPSKGHLEFTSHILAAYRELKEPLGGEKNTLAFLQTATLKAFNTWMMRTALKLELAICKQNPDRLYTLFSALMRQYGTSFDWEAPHAHKEGKCSFTFQINRCFYFAFFKAHGIPQLTTILCQLDKLWFDQIDPKKHGFRFDYSHYQTQGYGANTCLFPIIQE